MFPFVVGAVFGATLMLLGVLAFQLHRAHAALAAFSRAPIEEPCAAPGPASTALTASQHYGLARPPEPPDFVARNLDRLTEAPNGPSLEDDEPRKWWWGRYHFYL